MIKNKVHYDHLLFQIADYVHNYKITDPKILENAKLCLLDSLACAIMALKKPECYNLLGPIVPGTIVPDGSLVPGTNFVLDPIQATFNISSMIRWLDFNDTWLAAEWGHPSDNIGAILAVANYQSNSKAIIIEQALQAIIKAYEIQGMLALENSFNAVGLDHVILVKIASAAVSSVLLGCTFEQTMSTVSNAWIDGHSLRTYRHGVNTGSRKSWAAGDAAARGVHLAWFAKAGEDGCPHALDAKQWGFRDVLWHGNTIKLAKPFAHYVIDNILFKVRYPAEFHGQTAVEAGILLHPEVKNKLDQITRIQIETQSSSMRIINKSGQLRNYADRDHCLQYMLAVALLQGDLNAESYTDQFANNNPQIDVLRAKMHVKENPEYSKAYLDSGTRSIANSVQIFFDDNTSTDKVEILYPLGHKRRRSEAVSYLKDKYSSAINNGYASADQRQQLLSLWDMPLKEFYDLPVNRFMQLWITK